MNYHNASQRSISPPLTPVYLDAAAIGAALSPAAAVEAIADTLMSGFDPTTDIPRTTAHLTHGHFLLMPTEAGTVAGIKVATVAPDNPERGLPRILASYLLYDAETLALEAILDGTALTTLRTPAVSIAAVRPLLSRFSHPLRVVIFGAGPQAIGHVDTLAAVRDEPLAAVTFLLRTPEKAGSAIRERGTVDAIGSAEAAEALAEADVVICATSARSPLFQGDQVAASAIVIAVGSHEPDARELDTSLMGRAAIVVEDPATALREAGDVILARAEGALSAAELIPMKDIVMGTVTPPVGRPVVFKSVGMSWQDLVIANAARGLAP